VGRVLAARLGLTTAPRTITVIIPAFNEAPTITHVIDRVRAVDLQGLRKEIVVVDDGSTDGTQAALAPLREAGAVQVVVQPANRGKGAAIKAGLARAAGDLVIIQDADLELDPADYPRLVAPLMEDGATCVVFGSRFLAGPRLGQPLAILANWWLTSLTNLLFGSRLTDMGTCYKLCRTDVLRSLALESDGFEIESEISAKLLRRGYAIREVPVSYHPRTRAEGKTIKWHDGLRTLVTLFKWRLAREA
jgi:dolichol-phosphate mannosyltransferase